MNKGLFKQISLSGDSCHKAVVSSSYRPFTDVNFLYSFSELLLCMQLLRITRTKYDKEVCLGMAHSGALWSLFRVMCCEPSKVKELLLHFLMFNYDTTIRILLETLREILMDKIE